MNSFRRDIGYFRKHSSSLHFSNPKSSSAVNIFSVNSLTVFEKDACFYYGRHGEIMDLE